MKKHLLIAALIITTTASHSAQTLKFEEVNEVRKLKRGKEYSIKWSGGLVDQMVKIELHNLLEKFKAGTKRRIMARTF
ncbi:MAG: hypothetical protein U5K54_16935 [Cytophagales bacterium]|nr:hypothetical protein [Cytophagales bacterium]